MRFVLLESACVPSLGFDWNRDGELTCDPLLPEHQLIPRPALLASLTNLLQTRALPPPSLSKKCTNTSPSNESAEPEILIPLSDIPNPPLPEFSPRQQLLVQQHQARPSRSVQGWLFLPRALRFFSSQISVAPLSLARLALVFGQLFSPALRWILSFLFRSHLTCPSKLFDRKDVKKKAGSESPYLQGSPIHSLEFHF